MFDNKTTFSTGNDLKQSIPGGFGISIIILLCFAFELTGENTISNTSDSIENKSPGSFPDYQMSFAYWNDNYEYEKKLNDVMKIGKDDFVTASFWVQLAREEYNKWWFLDINLSVLTNRTANYRTDLLNVCLSQERLTSLGYVKFGSGIIASGKFGGDIIQNEYHKLRDIERIDLPYTGKNLLGLTGHAGYSLRFYLIKGISFGGYAANSLRYKAGPSNFNIGLQSDYLSKTYRKYFVYYLQTYAGYTHYYNLRRHLSPLFGSGLMWGGLISGGFHGNFNFALWMTINQYGKGQPHFGTTITFGWNGSKTPDLKDIFFP